MQTWATLPRCSTPLTLTALDLWASGGMKIIFYSSVLVAPSPSESWWWLSKWWHRWARRRSWSISSTRSTTMAMEVSPSKRSRKWSLLWRLRFIFYIVLHLSPIEGLDRPENQIITTFNHIHSSNIVKTAFNGFFNLPHPTPSNLLIPIISRHLVTILVPQHPKFF